MTPAPRSFAFGPFRLFPAEGLLLRDGQPVPLPPKTIDTLALLLEQAGHVVRKEELVSALWPETFVEEGNLTQQVWTLRKVLGTDLDGSRYIETVPKRGYRFAAPVTIEGAPDSVALEPAPPAGEDEAAGAAPSRWPVPAIAAVVVVIGVALAAFWSSRGTVDPPPHIGSLAILPFEVVGGKDGDEVLGLGIADALITRLSALEHVVVRSTAAIRGYTDPPHDHAAAARTLRVDALITGRLQRDGDRAHLSVQLVRVRDSATLWAATFDQPLIDLLGVQASIARQVAAVLAPALSGAERRRLATSSTRDVEAFRLYMTGRYLWNQRKPASLKRSIEYFHKAIDKDPGYALAYAGLADAYNMLGDYTVVPPHEAFPKARAAASRALELDDTLAEAHNSLAYARMIYDWDWPRAEGSFKHALQLNPNYATTYQWYALGLAAAGRHEEAAAAVMRAHELDPVSLIITANVGLVAYYGRQYERAVEWCGTALELDDDFLVARWIRGLAYLQQGRPRDAVDELVRARALAHRSPEVSAALGYALAIAGRTADSRKLLGELETQGRRQFVSSYLFAELHTALGEPDRAFQWLDKAYAERPPYLLFLRVEPTLDPLRGDARFELLLRRVGFPGQRP